jgi:hypothetical protein
MIGSILVLVVSGVLFLYWFRYTCLLILSARPARDYSGLVAEANQLSFPAIRIELRGATRSTDLPKLEELLTRDFKLLNCLMRQAAKFPNRELELEDRILLLDYRVMKIWYALMRPFAASQAHGALSEMSDIVAHLANTMGEHQVVAVRAR